MIDHVLILALKPRGKIRKVLELRDKGYSILEISIAVGLNKLKVQEICRKYFREKLPKKLFQKKIKGKFWSEKRKKEALDKYNNEISLEEVAKQYGITKLTLRSYFYSWGFPLRPEDQRLPRKPYHVYQNQIPQSRR